MLNYRVQPAVNSKFTIANQNGPSILSTADREVKSRSTSDKF